MPVLIAHHNPLGEKPADFNFEKSRTGEIDSATFGHCVLKHFFEIGGENCYFDGETVWCFNNFCRRNIGLEIGLWFRSARGQNEGKNPA